MKILTAARQLSVLLIATFTLITATTFTAANVQSADAVQANGCPPRALCADDDGADVDDDVDSDAAPASDTDTQTETKTEQPAKENSISRYGKVLIVALGAGIVILGGW